MPSMANVPSVLRCTCGTGDMNRRSGGRLSSLDLLSKRVACSFSGCFGCVLFTNQYHILASWEVKRKRSLFRPKSRLTKTGQLRHTDFGKLIFFTRRFDKKSRHKTQTRQNRTTRPTHCYFMIRIIKCSFGDE